MMTQVLTSQNPEHKFLFERSFDEVHPARRVTVTKLPSKQISGSAAVDVTGDPLSGEAESLNAVMKDQPTDVPSAPVFTQEQMDREVASAFADGRKEGLAEATSSAAVQALKVEDAIRTALDGMLAESKKLSGDAEDMAVQVALAVCRKTVPILAAKHGVDEVLGIVRKYSALIAAQPKVAVRVNPTLVYEVDDGLKEALARPEYDGILTVSGDPGIAPGDCDVSWPGGGISRNLAEILRDIDEAAMAKEQAHG